MIPMWALEFYRLHHNSHFDACVPCSRKTWQHWTPPSALWVPAWWSDLLKRLKQIHSHYISSYGNMQFSLLHVGLVFPNVGIIRFCKTWICCTFPQVAPLHCFRLSLMWQRCNHGLVRYGLKKHCSWCAVGTSHGSLHHQCMNMCVSPWMWQVVWSALRGH